MSAYDLEYTHSYWQRTKFCIIFLYLIRAYFIRNHNVHDCWYYGSHSFDKTAVIPAMRHARKFCWMAVCKLQLIQKLFGLPVIKCDLVILQNIHFSAKRTDRTLMDFRINMITFEGTMRKFGHTTAPEWIKPVHFFLSLLKDKENHHNHNCLLLSCHCCHHCHHHLHHQPHKIILKPWFQIFSSIRTPS